MNVEIGTEAADFRCSAGRNGIRKGRFLSKKLESSETGRAKGRKGRSWLRSGTAGIRKKYSLEGTKVIE
jgi:hypothetical protein